VGLANADDTSDLNKPISTATQTALNGKENTSNKGISNGYAGLDGSGKVPSTQLPSYVDDVIEVANFAALPVTGETGKIYITIDNNKVYRWSGTVYVEISNPNAVWGSITGTLSSQVDLQNALNAKFDDPTGTAAQYIDGTGALQTFPTFLESDALISEVYNSTGTTLTKGTIVYINGGQGNLPTVTRAQADNDANSAQTFGWVRDDIGNMSNGFVIVAGKLDNLNTNGLGTGTQLYLSPTTAGQYVTVKPQAPQHLVYVGIVVRDHPTQGVIEVKIQNGYELDELHDVLITNPSDGEILTFDSVSGLWQNQTIPPSGSTYPAVNTVLFADVATTEPLNTCTYNNGVAGVGATLTGSSNGQLSTVSFTGKIDNFTTALDQIVLVCQQSNKKTNGIYKVTQLGSPSQPFILTRIDEADEQSELYPLQANIYNGDTLANRAFLQKTVDPIIGTSDIVFTSSAIGITNTPVAFVDTVTSLALPSCTYTNGTNPSAPGVGARLTATSNGALGTINGVPMNAGRVLLVRNQASPQHNGDYIVTQAGSITTPFILTRRSGWASEFLRLNREWKVNNSDSLRFGYRYSTNLNSLSNTGVGTVGITLNEILPIKNKLISMNIISSM
jgi:hypothetical protein